MCQSLILYMRESGDYLSETNSFLEFNNQLSSSVNNLLKWPKPFVQPGIRSEQTKVCVWEGLKLHN